MKIEIKKLFEEPVVSIQEIYCNTVLETAEGNQVAILMRDGTIEFSVVGTERWHTVDMETGDVVEQIPAINTGINCLQKDNEVIVS